MWVRAVAVALAVWCVSGVAMAAGYAEEWNPPEASGHAVGKRVKKQPAAVKGKASAGSRVKATQVARAPHQAARLASAAGHHGGKATPRGNATKVAAKGKGAKSGARPAMVSTGANHARRKTVSVAQANKPRVQLAHANAGHGKIMRADLARPAHSHAVSVAAKGSAAVKPAGSHPGAITPVASANFNGGSADTSTNPATASSGSLPPIIH